MSDNNTRNTNRRKLLAGVAVVAVVAAGVLIVLGQESAPGPVSVEEISGARQRMSDLSRQPVAEQNAVEVFGDRLASIEAEMTRLREGNGELVSRAEAAEAEAERLRNERDEIRDEAAVMIEELAAEIDAFRDGQETPGTGAMRPTTGGPAGAVPAGQLSSMGDPFRPSGAVGASSPATGRLDDQGNPQIAPRALQSVDFTNSEGGDDASDQPARPIVRDTENYVPPNSYASARVLVGVDAATGTQFSSDPKPILLRITGQARSAIEGGRVLETDLEGCTVNGAAYGELSSEKVYVQLQVMTCPLNDGSGRVSEAEVEGYVAFGSKAGVRGRVISREGDLTQRAMIAGTLQGLGSAFEASAQPQGLAIGGTDVQTMPSGEEVAVAGLGGGVATAASTLAQYYIQRAEQYQPVVEMPTGIDVEIVFLRGVVVR